MLLTEKQIAASRYLSRLNLNTHTEENSINTFWCRAACARLEHQNRKQQRHSFFELHLCLEGSCEFMLDTQSVTLTKGTFLLLPPQKRHMLTSVSEDFEKLVWGFADRYSMSKFFKKAEGLPPAKYRSSLVE